MASSGSSDVFGFCGGEGDDGLKARLPGNSATAYLDEITRGGTSRIRIPCMIGVGVGVEELSGGRGSGRISEFIVESALEIPKEVLDRFPMLKTWILAEASKDSDAVSYVWTSVVTRPLTSGRGRVAGEWVQWVSRAYTLKRAGLYMDKMGNMGRDDRRVNRDGTVADKNTEKW